MKRQRVDRLKKLREEIMDAVRLFGLPETEETLGIVIMGVRKSGIENVKERDF